MLIGKIELMSSLVFFDLDFFMFQGQGALWTYCNTAQL